MEPLAPFNGTSEPMTRSAGSSAQEGLYTFVRWNTFFTNPPLIDHRGGARARVRHHRPRACERSLTELRRSGFGLGGPAGIAASQPDERIADGRELERLRPESPSSPSALKPSHDVTAPPPPPRRLLSSSPSRRDPASADRPRRARVRLPRTMRSCALGVAEVDEHQRAGPDRADRVRDALARDVRRRAVNRLEHRRERRARG